MSQGASNSTSWGTKLFFLKRRKSLNYKDLLRFRSTKWPSRRENLEGFHDRSYREHFACFPELSISQSYLK